MAPASENPTEEPTPQRLLKARQDGQVAVSRDFAAGFASPSLRLGVTGLSRAGKTVFITALVPIFVLRPFLGRRRGSADKS